MNFSLSCTRWRLGGKMFFILMFSALLITIYASGASAQFGEVESCDTSQLDECRKKVPRTPVGLPRNKEELDAHCFAFNTGMSCMDVWIKRCLPSDAKKIFEKQTGSGKLLMHFLCTNDTGLRRDYLKETQCWNWVAPGWAQCYNEISQTVRDISDRTQERSYSNTQKNTDLCCARDDYLKCVADASRVCSNSGSTLLKRIAFILIQDIATCPQQAETYCAAPPPPVTAPLFIALYGIIFYASRL